MVESYAFTTRFMFAIIFKLLFHVLSIEMWTKDEIVAVTTPPIREIWIDTHS